LLAEDLLRMFDDFFFYIHLWHVFNITGHFEFVKPPCEKSWAF
jgi:hypothetical protein